MAKTTTALTSSGATTVAAGTTEASPVYIGPSGSASSGWDLSTGYGADFSIRIANGATGPTIPCTVKMQISHDGGSTWYLANGSWGSAATNNGVYDHNVQVAYQKVRVRFYAYGNTAQDVTVTGLGTQVTSL